MNAGRYNHLVVTLIACSFLALASTYAVQKTWDGGAGDTLWSSAANWDPDGVPTPDVDDVTINTNALINLGGLTITNSLVGRTIRLYNCTLTNGWMKCANSGTDTGSLIATNVTIALGGFYAWDGSVGIGADYYQTPMYAVLSNCYYKPPYRTTPGWVQYYNGYLKVYGGTFVCYGGLGTYTRAGDTAEIIFDGGGPHQPGAPMTLAGNSSSAGTSIMTIRNTTVRSDGGGQAYWHQNNNPGTAVVSLINATNIFGGVLSLGSNCTVNVTNALLEFQYTHGVVTRFYNNITNSAKFDGEGLTIYYNPSATYIPPFSYEVAGWNRGAVFTGFHDNYSIDQLRVGFSATGKNVPMALTNDINNSGSGGAEALYADVFNVVTNATIDFQGFNIYYKKLVGNISNLIMSNGAPTQVTGAVLIAASPYVHAPEGALRFTKGDAPLAIGSDYGTAYVSGFPAGQPVLVDLVVSGTQGNIDALRAEIGGRGSGTNIRMPYAGIADSTLFFDWNFSHRGVTLTSFSAEVFFKGTIFSVF